MRPVLNLVPLTLAAGLVLAACTADRPAPTAPATTTAMATPALSADVSGPATPPFNDEIILRAVGDGSGFGHVKFRQPKDEELVVHLDVWVRDLAPNASYRLQRAVDTNVNDDCTGTSWLTLGEGPPGGRRCGGHSPPPFWARSSTSTSESSMHRAPSC